jgi:Phage integrase family
VFVSELIRTLYPGSVTHMMTRLINAYKEPNHGKDKPAEALPQIRLHDRRHVHATSLLLAGVPVHVVSERLGHADPAITLRVYAHVLRKQASDTADVFRSLVEGGRFSKSTMPSSNTQICNQRAIGAARPAESRPSRCTKLLWPGLIRPCPRVLGHWAGVLEFARMP